MEILNTYIVYSENFDFIMSFAIVGFVVTLFFFVMNLFMKEWKITMVCFVILIIMGLGSYSLGKLKYDSQTFHHEVIITNYDEVDFEKYQIVEQKGKIIVLKELKK